MPTIDALDPEVRAAYNDSESLAEFGEWCAMRLFGDTPETVTSTEEARNA